MIHYSLRCDNGHAFDAWFRSSDDFAAQATAGHLTCPICNSPDVSRALMAPAVRTARAPAPTVPEIAGASDAEHTPAQPPAEPSRPQENATHVALSDKSRAEFVEAVRAMRAAVMEHGKDVGRAFPEEARRIHYGEAEPSGIYGQASADEARALIEEGVDILPLPPLPEDRN